MSFVPKISKVGKILCWILAVIGSRHNNGAKAFVTTSTRQDMGKGNDIFSPFLKYTKHGQPQRYLHFSMRDRLYFLGGKSTLVSVFSSRTTGDQILEQFPGKVEGLDIAGAMYALATADCVCFDVDSTVLKEEGIDELGRFLGKDEQIEELTRSSMGGGMTWDEANAAQLEIVKPSKTQIQDFLDSRPINLTDGIEDLVKALQEAGKDVYLVSGGFRIIIEPVAEFLNIPKQRLIAQTLFFDDETGEYSGFDPDEPTSRDMGKPVVLERLERTCKYKTMVIVGDGVTDGQAKPPAKAFIGFGGVVVREKVRATADWFVMDFSDLTHVVRNFGGNSS